MPVCEDGSVSHWINVSLPLTTPLDLVAGRRVAQGTHAALSCPPPFPSIPSPLFPLQNEILPPSIGSLMQIHRDGASVGRRKQPLVKKCARWKSSRVISFPLTGLRNAAIVEYIPRQKAMIYIESIRGTEADGTRGWFEIGFGFTEGGYLKRGWTL